MSHNNLNYVAVTTNPKFQWFNMVYCSLMLLTMWWWWWGLGNSGRQGHSGTKTVRGSILTQIFMIIQAGNRKCDKLCTGS